MKLRLTVLAILALLTSCTSTDSTTVTTKAPDGTITVSESLEAMKERLFQERCAKVLEGAGL